MQIVSIGDNLHEMSMSVFWEIHVYKKKKILYVVCWKFYPSMLGIKRQFYVYFSLRHLLWNGIIFCTIVLILSASQVKRIAG